MTRIELEQAYRATDYCVTLPGGSEILHIDRCSPRLQDCLKGETLQTFAIISAYNPGSRLLDVVENQARHADLLARLQAGVRHETRHVAHQGDWPDEYGVLIFGITETTATALGRTFGQNAILFGGADAIPRLTWI